MIAVAVYLGLRTGTPVPVVPVESVESVEQVATPRRDEAVRAPFEDREHAARVDEPHEREPTAPESTDPAKTNVDATPALASAPTVQSSGAIAKLASAEVEAMRGRIRTECWDKLPAGDADPASVPILVNLSFGPDGKVIASGTKESRDARRDGVANCVGTMLHGMEIAPTGAHAAVEISVDVP